MHILLIEDNPDHIFLARQAIKDTWNNATLHVARDLHEARVLLRRTHRRTHFDLLLATLDPRDVDGLARLRELRACPPLKGAHVIALVNSTRDQELAQVANQSVDWIMLKPLRAEALREAMQQRRLP